jgi:hypothetical protein
VSLERDLRALAVDLVVELFTVGKFQDRHGITPRWAATL